MTVGAVVVMVLAYVGAPVHALAGLVLAWALRWRHAGASVALGLFGAWCLVGIATVGSAALMALAWSDDLLDSRKVAAAAAVAVEVLALVALAAWGIRGAKTAPGATPQAAPSPAPPPS